MGPNDLAEPDELNLLEAAKVEDYSDDKNEIAFKFKLPCPKMYHGLVWKEVGKKGRGKSGRFSKQTKIRITF